jgi:hypothetical protein
MDTGSRWRHLQLNGDEPELLRGASGTDAAVADDRGGLPVPFRVGVVEGVLEHGRDTAIIFGRHEDIAVELSNLLLPALRDLVLGRYPRVRRHFIEKGHRIVTEVENFNGHVVALRRDVVDPPRRLVAEARGAGAADDDGYLELLHGEGYPSIDFIPGLDR